jgi:hypothetical protein
MNPRKYLKQEIIIMFSWVRVEDEQEIKVMDKETVRILSVIKDLGLEVF